MLSARGLVSCQFELMKELAHFCFSWPINASASSGIHHSISSVSTTPPETLQTSLNFLSRKKIKATMISAKRFVQMAKKWQRIAALTRKRLTSSTPTEETEGSCCTSASVADKGHCVVYSADGRRFEVPLAYLSTAVFGKLLMLSQEEFGFTGEDGRILLPCDAMVMDYVMCLLRKGASAEVERAFLSSMAGPCHYGNYLTHFMGVSQRSAVCSF